MRPPLTIILLLAAAWLPCGCHHPHTRLAVEPTVRMEDLVSGLPMPDGGYVLLTDESSTGRFACPLALAKLIPRVGEGAPELLFVAFEPHEEAYWEEGMRGVLALRDLQFLRPVSIRPEGQSVTAMCDGALRLGAPLLLIYVPNQLGPNSARVLGALYDTQTRVALATLCASSRVLNDDNEEVSPAKKRGDQRAQDAHYQAQRAFERQALACLTALIHRDTRPTTIQPNKWDQPFLERWWLFRR